MLNISQSFKNRRILMKLQDLIYFRHLASSLNFTKTAEYFFVSQPSVSMALKRLDDELDTVLIDRGGGKKNLKLTETGTILFTYSSDILNKIDELKMEVYNTENQVINFGYLPTIGGYFLPKLSPYIKEFNQALNFIEEESSDIMLDLVQSGEVPAAIIGSDKPTFSDDKLLQIPLTVREMSLWSSPDHRLADRDLVHVEDLKDEILVSLTEGYAHHRIFEKWIEDHYDEHPKVLYTKEIQTALSMTSSRETLSFLIDLLVKDKGELVEIPLEDAPKFYVSLIVNTESTMNYKQTTFNRALIEFAESYSE